jgi:hypothetical protein
MGVSGVSDWLYGIALVLYMQAMPTKLVGISVVVNLIVFAWKLWRNDA